MKRAITLLLIAAMVLCGATAAYADTVEGGRWYVHFTSNAKMDSNFDEARGGFMSEAFTNMEPGDNAIFYMEVANEHKESTDWYMTNEVLRTLEQSQDVAEGGAYTYILTYYGPDGTTDVLYSSESVGGEDEENVDEREGLREATSSLEDWFYLDTLEAGESGNITLEVAMEGETQGNAYQDTLAQLQMNFAVELTKDPTTRTVYTPVRTGDDGRTMIWSAVMLGCGLAALGLAVVRTRDRKEESEDA